MLAKKKGWLRILEAFIAIILIMGVLIVLYSKTIGRPTKGEEIYRVEKTILEEIASKPELRNAVLNETNETLINFTSERIPAGFAFAIKICDIGVICELAEYKGREGKDIYSSERIISSTLERYNPRKLKIFMWEE